MTYHALHGVRIVDLGGNVAALYTGKLLADLGAEVILVEPPGGDPVRGLGPWPSVGDADTTGLPFRYLASNRRGVALDLGRPEGRSLLLELIDDADAVIEGRDIDELTNQHLTARELRQRTPELVVCSLSSYGRTGPLARTPASEICLQAAGGWMYGIGHPDREPLKAPGVQAQLLAGLCGAMATLAALRAARRDGLGDHLDVSIQEAVLLFLMNPTTVYAYSGQLWERAGGRSTTNHPQGVMPCKDGLVGVNVMYYVEWDRLCDLLDRPGWHDDPRVATPLDRLHNARLIDEVLLAWLAERTVDEVLAEAQAAKLPFSRVATIDDLLASPQLAHRRYWQTLEDPEVGAVTVPGQPFVMTHMACDPPTPAPSHPMTGGSR